MRPLRSSGSVLSSVRPRDGQHINRIPFRLAPAGSHSLHTTCPRSDNQNNEDPSAHTTDQNSTISTESEPASLPQRRSLTKSAFRKLTRREQARLSKASNTLYPRYTKEELEEVKGKYSATQYKSIEEAEKAINPAHLTRGRPRSDVLAPREFDSTYYARIQPVIDKRPERIRGEWDNTDDNDKYRGNHRVLPDEKKKMNRILDILTDARYNPHDALDARREAINAAVKQGKPIPPPGDHQEQERTLGKQLGDLFGHTSRETRELKKAFFAQIKAERENDKVDMASVDEEAAMREVDKRRVLDQRDDTAIEREAARISRELADKEPGSTPTKSTRRRLEDALNWRLHSTPELAPDIPRIDDPKVIWESPAEQAASQQAAGMDDATVEALARLSKSLGLSVAQILRFRTKVLVNHRVVNQTRLGKIASQYVLCVAGDGDGLVGLGEGKAFEMDTAMRAARLAAIRAMKPVLRYENRTIFGHVNGKVGATELTLRAARPGFGLRVSGRLFEIARAAGIYDLSGAVTRARNPMNTCKAMIQALTSQRNPEDIAKARGRKLVDVRRVYYAGNQ